MGEAGRIVSKYNNPRSKRKQKQREKRQAKEMCMHHTIHARDESKEPAWCISPEEFARRERHTTFSSQEKVGVTRKRKHYTPKPLTAAA